jgi:phosphoribosylanthranilate isomerase
MQKSFSFDWSYLRDIEIEGWFLAGGINSENLNEAKNISKKIDISSELMPQIFNSIGINLYFERV